MKTTTTPNPGKLRVSIALPRHSFGLSCLWKLLLFTCVIATSLNIKWLSNGSLLGVVRLENEFAHPTKLFHIPDLTGYNNYSDVIDKKRSIDRRLPSSAQYAYSFVIGAVHENRTAYKGFLYNIIICVQLLKELGSVADFVVWAQLSQYSSLDEIPREDLRLFDALGIHVITMEKPKYESFAHLMYDKFRALQLTNYKRIIYLDSDVTPLVNLDYLFFLSDQEHKTTPTLLKPNIIWTSRGAPCNGGMLMMHPYPNAWDEMEEVIKKQHEKGKTMPYPHFDWKEGWGHNFLKSGDHWEAIERTGTGWRFHGGHSDQGLWYYFSKYVAMEVSILIGERVQNWVPNDLSEMPMIESEKKGGLNRFSAKPLAYQARCHDDSKSWMCIPPWRDLAHFMGSNKPWQVGVGKAWYNGTDSFSYHAPHRLWFRELKKLNIKLNMSLNIERWDQEHLMQLKESPLGYMPMFGDNAHKILNHGNSPRETVQA